MHQCRDPLVLASACDQGEAEARPLFVSPPGNARIGGLEQRKRRLKVALSPELSQIGPCNRQAGFGTFSGNEIICRVASVARARYAFQGQHSLCPFRAWQAAVQPW
jgi:hypothetical protein